MALIPLVLAATLAGLTGVSRSDTNKWLHAGLGFDITHTHANPHGLWVRFRTDQPPPYLVGVYDPAHLGLARCYPLEHVITDGTSVFLPSRHFLEATVFLQVGTVEGMLQGQEIKEADFTVLKDGPPVPGSEDLNWGASPPYDWESADTLFTKIPKELTLLEDYTWGAFLPGDLTGYQVRTVPERQLDYYWGEEVVWSVYRIDEVETVDSSTSSSTVETTETLLSTNSTLSWPGGQDNRRLASVRKISDTVTVYSNWFHVCRDPRTNTVVRSRQVEREEPWLTIPAMDTAIGTGYRIVTFEDHGRSTIHRAYSLRPDRSDEYVIRKPLKALSAWDGRCLRFDWMGRPYYAPNTNAIPGRLYMNGVPW